VIIKQEHTYYANIFIAGDISAIKNICVEFCDTGMCVTVTPTEYIYTHGRETGAIVGLINYPRFPKSPESIENTALELAEDLLLNTYQGSCSVQFPDKTVFMSRREEE